MGKGEDGMGDRTRQRKKKGKGEEERGRESAQAGRCADAWQLATATCIHLRLVAGQARNSTAYSTRTRSP